APGMEAAGRHLQAAAHQSNRVLIAVTSDRLVPQDDSLAKNAAASRKKSRSFFTRANSRLSASNSWSRDTPAPGKGFLVPDANSRRHRQSRFEPMPSSWAIWLMLASAWCVRPTASRLNSSLNFLLCRMTLLLPHDE